MHLLRDLSIRWKLTFMIMAVVAVVLIVSFTFIVNREIERTKAQMVNQYTVLAQVVAAGGYEAIKVKPIQELQGDTLSVQLLVSNPHVDESVVFVVLYDGDGNEVARQVRQERAGQELTLPDIGEPRFTDGDLLEIVAEFELTDNAEEGNDASEEEDDGATDAELAMGKVYLGVSTKRLDAMKRSTWTIAIVVFCVAMPVTLLLSLVVQTLISRPILDLADTSQRVSLEHDYSLRAKKRANDELGRLCDSFNVMLAEIQLKEDELARSNNELEGAVAQMQSTVSRLGRT